MCGFRAARPALCRRRLLQDQPDMRSLVFPMPLCEVKNACCKNIRVAGFTERIMKQTKMKIMLEFSRPKTRANVQQRILNVSNDHDCRAYTNSLSYGGVNMMHSNYGKQVAIQVVRKYLSQLAFCFIVWYLLTTNLVIFALPPLFIAHLLCLT